MVSPEMLRIEKKSVVQGFQCPACKERKNIEGDRELITTGERIQEVDEFYYLGNVGDCEADQRNVRDCEADQGKSSESKGSSGVQKMEGDGSLITNRSIPL